MVKLNLSTSVWKIIFVDSPLNKNISGKSGSLSLNGGTIMTPYEAVYGHTPPVLLPYTPNSSLVQVVDMVL